VRPRISYANVVATVALIVALGGTAVAATSIVAKNGQITGCYRKSGKAKGTLRVVAAKTKCRKTESRLTFNQRGPAGPAGTSGAGSGLGGAGGSAGAAGSDATSPAGAVGFFALASCPSGWTAYAPAQGRYVVGLPAGGSLESTVGTALANGENRPTGQHTHSITDPGHTHDVQVDPILVGGNVASVRVTGTADEQASMAQTVTAKALPSFTGITVNATGDVPGTNAPYLQLLACKKA